MITKVILENFQAHEYSEINLTEGVNVISGASDQGKSSVIRAIKWVAENRPSGFAFKKDGSKGPTRVTLELDNGNTVIKERTNSEHFYHIKYVDGRKDVILKALRTDVPDEIKNILNFGEYNIQSQTDGAFLIDTTSGEAARMLNVLSGISIIDSVLKETNKRIRDRKAAKEANESLLKEAKLKLVSFKNLDKAKKLFDEAKEIYNDKEENLEGWKQLTALIYNYGVLEAQEKEAVDIAAVSDLLKRLKTHLDELSGLQECYVTLESLLLLLASTDKDLQDYAGAAKCGKIKNELSTLTPDYQENTHNYTELLALVEMYEDSKQQEAFQLKEVIKIQKELEQFKKENNVCPVCKNTW